MKQVLVLFAIIFVSVPLAKAEDDKWIDGIKFRYGEYNYPMSIGKKGANEDDAIWKSKCALAMHFTVLVFFSNIANTIELERLLRS